MQKLLGTLGITVETYRRGAHADSLSPYRPWTDDERKLVEREDPPPLRPVPDDRRQRAQGQGVTAARVNELGRGQVWTGAQALGLGLVDSSRRR